MPNRANGNQMDFIHSIPNNCWCLIGFEFSRYRPFVVMPIPNSNLILLVKDKNCPPLAEDRYYRMTVESNEYKYDTSCNSEMTPCLTCFKATNRKLYRRRPASCISQNKNVRSISLFKWVVYLSVVRILILPGIWNTTMWTREHNINQLNSPSISNVYRSNSLTTACIQWAIVFFNCIINLSK